MKGEYIGKCESCLKRMYDTQPYSYDSVNGLTFCEECSPSYQDMLDAPGSFYDGEEEYLTPERAKEIVDAHIASGGQITDKVGVHRP